MRRSYALQSLWMLARIAASVVTAARFQQMATAFASFFNSCSITLIKILKRI
jgi:hypothetical protein